MADPRDVEQSVDGRWWGPKLQVLDETQRERVRERENHGIARP